MNYIVTQITKNSKAVAQFVRPMNNSKDWKKMQEEYAAKKMGVTNAFPYVKVVSA